MRVWGRLLSGAAALGLLALSVAVIPLGAAAMSVPAPAAKALAQTVLNKAIIPTNAMLIHPVGSPICQCAGTPGVAGIATATRYYAVRGSADSVFTFITTHVPKGGTIESRGNSTSGNGATTASVVVSFPANGPHVYLRQIAYSTARRNSSTAWLRVDSQVVWIPSRSPAQDITGATSGTATGFARVWLSGSGGDVKVRVSGNKLTTLIRTINSLPLGPANDCMESLNGFNLTIALKSGATAHIYNGFCAGPSNGVAIQARGSTTIIYILSDPSCALIKDVASLFSAKSVPGTMSALKSCESWAKSNA